MDNTLKVIKSHLTPEFVEALEDLFPNKRPYPGTPMDQVWFNSGQASVAEFLRFQLEEGDDNILESSHVSQL